jgi:hypothetical protein
MAGVGQNRAVHRKELNDFMHRGYAGLKPRQPKAAITLNNYSYDDVRPGLFTAEVAWQPRWKAGTADGEQ